ncbi:MAG: penicillin acylase family protein [Bacteroidota bacterium]
MKTFKITLSLVITLALIYALNRNWGQVPALGKFLSPFQGFWQNAEKGVPKAHTLELKGLQGEVTVFYDSMMIPHIYATTEEDLFRAQGYVTAAHRLWQMEFQTHAGAGRISEIIGAAALDYDRRQRRLGMVSASHKTLERMQSNPIAAKMVNAYTAGINDYIASLDNKSLPFEYKLLNYKPEPWTPLKCALLLQNMAQTLNIGDKDFEMTNALKLFGKETVDLLYPDRELVGDPIVDNAGNWKFQPIDIDTLPLAVPEELITQKPQPRPHKNVGSNNWAVSGTRTATGAPMLCNDPHLTLSLPSIWYAIHLNAPGYNAMGASLPGSPAVISGFNDSIAWGVTNAQRDLVDWYKIKMKDATNKEYLSDGKWKPVKTVVEHIKVKGGSDFYDTVRYTHHGPIVYDPQFHGEDEKSLYAFRWIAHEPAEEIVTFYKLNKAKNYDDYMEALNHFGSPAQNFAFASVQGDIAMRIQGRYPVRRQQEGRFVLDGTKTAYEWQAFIPNEQNVMYKNPARGFVSSANQYPADATYPYYVTAVNFEAYRNRRINQVLSRLDSATVRDMMNLQFDTYNLKAAESVPLFLSHLDTTALNETETKAWQLLKSWDFYYHTDSEAASYHEAWWRAINTLTWDEMRDSKMALETPTAFTTIKLIKEQPNLSFFDVQGTAEKETATDVIRRAFREGVQTVEKWKAEKGKAPRWADYKDTYIGHLLRQEPLSVHVEHGGHGDAVNASSRTHGPSWRMVVSLEKEGVQAWGIYPGGQSGNPGSPFYNNMIAYWAKGAYFKLPFYRADRVAASAITTLTLKPASE